MTEITRCQSESTNTPLYLQIAHKLERQIVSGERAVGSLLPPEAELAVQLGVSRHTIRQAIQQLRQRGMLAARKGVGTRVESARPQWRDRFRDNNRDDLFEFASETEMFIRVKERRELRGKLATEIGCRPGKSLLYMEGPRHFINEPTPFCWNEVYLDPIAEPVIRDMDIQRSSLFHLVEAHTGERIVDIQQEIRAVTIAPEICTKMGLPQDTIGLRITRRYLSSGGRLMEYAIQTSPADSFAYRTHIQAA
ncbi:GntR family transcriptional regulator [Paracoccus sp. 1_MG-2023]|uniref:GntR family transcriptional regulator n=1 Tax=unclassified Paracoccus (in: a-proteobacteria) TaxID=2688777 RepID=UPI001C08D367|nr:MULTISPECIES: GntR family transcriptional regulator [unclassified Paracoccus (in: a-proteobacteria)]MBU2957642.1 GntR family transcriptional regulator [Paracoccus sp. C2R09]MDO6667511.1 GntR family transcriptional regulator [Paracoccus sp. 1_MG-2023]